MQSQNKDTQKDTNMNNVRVKERPLLIVVVRFLNYIVRRPLETDPSLPLLQVITYSSNEDNMKLYGTTNAV
jgi:hypothetical protein